MSIRARVAFGLVCLERTLRHIGLDEARLEPMLSELWRYTESDDLSGWGCRRDVTELREYFGVTVPVEKLEFLEFLLHELDEIGGGNLFGGFRNEYTLAPAMKLAARLLAEGIELPPMEEFIRISPRRWWNAWGKPFAATELRSLLK